MAVDITNATAKSIVWGVAANLTAGAITGEIQSYSIAEDGDQTIIRGQQGDAKVMVTSDRHKTLTITVITATSLAAATYDKGKTFSFNGTTWRITDAREEWSNESAKQVTITARTFETIDTGTGTGSGT